MDTDKFVTWDGVRSGKRSCLMESVLLEEGDKVIGRVQAGGLERWSWGLSGREMETDGEPIS